MKAIDPVALAARVDISQPIDEVRRQIAEVIVSAVAAMGGKVVGFRKCLSPRCNQFFRVGVNLPGHFRADRKYCCEACRHTHRRIKKFL